MVYSAVMLQRGEVALALQVLPPLYALLAQPQQAYYLTEAYYARSLQAAAVTDQLHDCTRALDYAQEALNSPLHRQRASPLLQTMSMACTSRANKTTS